MRTAFLLLAFAVSASAQDHPFRIVIGGLNHGHASGFFHALKNRADVDIVGIYDPSPELHAKYAKQFGFDSTLFSTNLDTMLDRLKPEAVAAFTSTAGHLAVVEACAARHIPVMMEKPLAIDMNEARAIERASKRGNIPVIVNYETTWYASHGAMWRMFKQEHAAGAIRKMVAMDGHQGPKEINVGPEFLSWLTDPAQNGAGALFDFGCYGANLMTWMMDNQRPIAVTALAHTNKPQIYARVDDEATILVQYAAGAQGIIEASWNWPFSRKDFEMYGEHGYAVAVGGDTLRVRLDAKHPEETRKPEPLPENESGSVSYLKAVARGKLKPAGLSSLENNMIVVEILSAARESVKSGKTVALSH